MLLVQTLADVTGRPVEVMDGGGEAVGAGAAMLAGVATGSLGPGFASLDAAVATLRAGQAGGPAGAARYEPDPARHALYSSMYEEVYCPILEALGPISEAMAKLSASTSEP